jgi:hypothetical protein
MKYLLLFVAFLPLSLVAQDCKLKTEKDQFTQQPRITTGFMPLNSSKLSITADSKELDFFIALSGDNCFDDASTLTILFDDGRTKSNYRSSGSMNCEGLFHFTIRNTPTSNSNLVRLETKKVKSLKLTNGKTITDIELTEVQKDKLQALVVCISKEAKTLIPKP